MLKAISRYGLRVLPNTEQIAKCKRQGADSRTYRYLKGLANIWAGVMLLRRHSLNGLLYILKAFQFPGSEIIFLALTFWVIPELLE
jgi:hypothetical protein